MEADKFSQIDPVLDDITEIIQDQFESEQLRQAIKTIGDIVGKGRTACFKVVVEIFDEKKECTIPYLAMGLISDANGEPYTSWDDAALQRYVTKDGIVRAVIVAYRWGMIANCYSIMTVAPGVMREPLPQQILLAASAMPWLIRSMWCGDDHE